MNWIYIGLASYIIVLILVCLRIIFETRSTNKTLAYLLFCLFLPIIGIGFYMAFGINYWRVRRYSKKYLYDKIILEQLQQNILQYNEVALVANNESVKQNAELSAMLLKDLGSPLTANNSVKLLTNGEQKFPEMLQAIRLAQHHIHLEYYIFEYDKIGTELIDLLILKAQQGVKVKMIYDDFGSPTINKKTEKRMQAAGVQIFPFHKIRFYLLANRLNYRNHSKIVVIDGNIAFVGGINVSDKYINNNSKKLFWRDTHIKIEGAAVYYLQYLFFADWHFCCEDLFDPTTEYFPVIKPTTAKSYVQIAASGPNSIQPSILFTLLQAIYLANEEILITTPYFIPGDSIIDALRIAGLSGLKVKLLVPGISDSKIVNAASKSNYNRLLEAGVEIYLYKKGFIHAKSLITDSKLIVVGTANMDYRSFDLNFEVNAIVYDADVATELRNIFFKDLADAEKIDPEKWLNRKWYTQFPERIARLFSPVL